MALRANEDMSDKANHLIISLKKTVEFTSGWGLTNHDGGMWNAAVREIEELLVNRGVMWNVVEIRDS